MSLIDNNNTLLREMLGKGAGVVFTTAAQTTKDFYAIHFVTESVIASITMANLTGESALQTTIAAGTVIYGRCTAITLTSGLAIGYTETDGKTGE
tara:strand:- start:6995 stop:7279 length:285 start_codon:yes stop_codon:yes gene_type:complete